jgi:hypothetical protein
MPQSGDRPTSFIIEMGSFSGADDLFRAQTIGPDTSFTTNAATTGILFVRVKGINSAGVGPASNEVVAIVVDTPRADLDPSRRPGSPKELAAWIDGSKVTLFWKVPADGGLPSSYRIEAGSLPGSGDLANVSTGSSVAMLAVANVPSGRYFVRVLAENQVGLSLPSNEIEVVVGGPAPCSGPPEVPFLLRHSLNGKTVLLTWEAGLRATSYLLEVGSASGASDLLIHDAGSSLTSFSAGNVPVGTYFIRIKSRNTCGTSAASNEIVVIVQ